MSDVVQPLRPADIQDLSPADLAQRLSQFESMRLAQMADSRDQLWEEMQVHGRNSGVPMPWDEMHGKWGWREGEVTLIAGPNNSAKSALMSQMALHYSRYHPVGMMSLEEPFRAQVYRFQKQAFATDNVTREQFNQLCDFTRDRIWHYKVYGTVQPARAYGCVDAFHKRGCKLVVIDNVQKCGVSEDIDEQRDFMNALIGLAEMGVHIVLIHHTRKRPSGHTHHRATSDDVRGAGAFTDLATNLILVNRNIERGEALEKQASGKFLTSAEQDLLDETADLDVQIRKQKFGAMWNGTLKLYYGNGMTFKDQQYGNDIKLPLRTVEGI